MKTEILSRVADLIRNPEAPMRLDHTEQDTAQKTEAAPVVQDSSSLEKPDTLTLSPVAQKLIDESDNPKESQWEQTRSERVDRLRELVQTNKYGFAPEVIDKVAQNIVSLLP